MPPTQVQFKQNYSHCWCVAGHLIWWIFLTIDACGRFVAELPLPDRGNVFYAMRKDVIDVRFLVKRRSDVKHKHKMSKRRSRSLARIIFWCLCNQNLANADITFLLLFTGSVTLPEWLCFDAFLLEFVNQIIMLLLYSFLPSNAIFFFAFSWSSNFFAVPISFSVNWNQYHQSKIGSFYTS